MFLLSISTEQYVTLSDGSILLKVIYLSSHKNVAPGILQVKQYNNVVDWILNMTAHAQKPDFVFQRNGRVHLNRRGRQFSRLLTAEVCASAVVMLDTPCCEVV